MIRWRQFREIEPGRWAEYREIHKKVLARQRELGMENPRLFSPLTGRDSLHTEVAEREFESLTAMEAAFEKWRAAGAMTDPQLQELRRQYRPLIVSARRELLQEL